MQVKDILTQDRCFYDLPGESKKRLFVLLSRLAASCIDDMDSNDVFQPLIDRERLGTTSIRGGIALPHARITGIDNIVGIFLKLADAVDFDADDDQPVDLVFALFVPEEEADEHVKTLSRLAAIFSSADNCTKFRQAGSAEELYQLVITFDQPS